MRVAHLLISRVLHAKTHEGAIGLIGQFFIRTGILDKEYGSMIARLQNMRHSGDYDDFIDWQKEDVEPFFTKVESYISAVKRIIYPDTQ